MRRIKVALMLTLAAMALLAAGCGGCGDDESSTQPAQSGAALVPPATTTESDDPEQAAADRAARAKVFTAVMEGIEEDRDELKKTLIRPERSKFIPQPPELDEDQIEAAPSSGERISTGFASFEVPKGWAERTSQRGPGTAGANQLTQLVPAGEVKENDAEATYSAAITIQELPKSPLWANASEKDMVQYAMLYDSADPTKAFALTVDGSAAVGFGLETNSKGATSVYTANGGNLFRINGSNTNPTESSGSVQAAVLTIVNTWSWD